MYQPDQIEQLAKAIPVSSIATSPVVAFASHLKCQEVWAQIRPEAMDIDVVLVESPSNHEVLVASREESWASSSEEIGRYATPVDERLVVSPGFPLRDALKILEGSAYLLCRSDGVIGAIATITDLQKPAASLLALGTIFSFETAIALLFPSLTDRRWMEHLGKTARCRLVGEIESRKRAGSYISDEECLSLVDKLKIARTVVRPKLGMSGKTWDDLVGRMVSVRNDLAHARTLLSGSRDHRQILERLAELDSVSRRLWELVEDREEVWDSYLRTHCLVEVEGVLAGVEAVRSTLPSKFWMLSAQNPFEQVLPDQANLARHRALVEDCQRREFFVGVGIGRAPEADGWSENMVLASGLDREVACRISGLFGQRSVFEFEGDEFRVIEVQSQAVRRFRILRDHTND